MHDLHPELASTPSVTCSQDSRQGAPRTELIHDFYPLSSRPWTKGGKGPNHGSSPSAVEKSAQEFIVLTHDPSSSLYSIRLPPIDDNSISVSGRRALQKLREEVHFPLK